MKFFTIKELTESHVAVANKIDNTPSNEIIKNLKQLVDNILDPLRLAIGCPIKITSGYRCQKLNDIVKGASKSQHILGQAADITIGSQKNNKRLFDLIITLNLPFDQCIDEYGYKWIHISYSSRNRKQILHIK